MSLSFKVLEQHDASHSFSFSNSSQLCLVDLTTCASLIQSTTQTFTGESHPLSSTRLSSFNLSPQTLFFFSHALFLPFKWLHSLIETPTWQAKERSFHIGRLLDCYCRHQTGVLPFFFFKSESQTVVQVTGLISACSATQFVNSSVQSMTPNVKEFFNPSPPKQQHWPIHK